MLIPRFRITSIMYTGTFMRFTTSSIHAVIQRLTVPGQGKFGPTIPQELHFIIFYRCGGRRWAFQNPKFVCFHKRWRKARGMGGTEVNSAAAGGTALLWRALEPSLTQLNRSWQMFDLRCIETDFSKGGSRGFLILPSKQKVSASGSREN